MLTTTKLIKKKNLLKPQSITIFYEEICNANLDCSIYSTPVKHCIYQEAHKNIRNLSINAVCYNSYLNLENLVKYFLQNVFKTNNLGIIPLFFAFSTVAVFLD